MEDLLYQKQQQYEIFKENIELLNIKCHDLKHWLQNMDGSIHKEEALEIQKALSVYDAMMDTGNKTLDVILTEKKLYCEYNNIHLTCIAQGEPLHFLTEAEIYSLFGNILDNAIEAVSGLQDEDKRAIHLLVKYMGRFLSVHEENYYAGELRKDFKTTKTDKRHHGFGLKSIRMIAERYQGSVSVHAEDGVFNINILLPIGEEKVMQKKIKGYVRAAPLNIFPK